MELNRQIDLRRLPKAPGVAEESKEELIEMGAMFDWLLKIDFEKAVDKCMKSVNLVAENGM